MAWSKKACIIFFDEVNAIGGAWFDDGAGGDNEVQRTRLYNPRFCHQNVTLKCAGAQLMLVFEY